MQGNQWKDVPQEILVAENTDQQHDGGDRRDTGKGSKGDTGRGDVPFRLTVETDRPAQEERRKLLTTNLIT